MAVFWSLLLKHLYFPQLYSMTPIDKGSIGPQTIEVTMDPSVNNSALHDVPESVKLLFLTATPRRLATVNTGRESRFKDLIREFDRKGRLHFIDEYGLNRERFRNILFTEKPHIIHFAGHGHSEGLSLEDSDINSEVLIDLIRLLPSTQLIVLNACNTLPMAKEMAKYIPFVIGTQGSIDDDAAIAFARSFYVGVANGDSIERSFNFGLLGIKDERPGPQEQIPVLVKGVPPSGDTLRNSIDRVLLGRFQEARNNGWDSVEITSSDIHKELKLENRYPAVCAGMRRFFNTREGDEVIYSPPKGNGATLKFRYKNIQNRHFPRS